MGNELIYSNLVKSRKRARREVKFKLLHPRRSKWLSVLLILLFDLRVNVSGVSVARRCAPKASNAGHFLQNFQIHNGNVHTPSVSCTPFHANSTEVNCKHVS